MHFLNTWSDKVASMNVVPSEMELYTLFVDQVRRYRPMADTWNLLDQQILPNVSYPPTYQDYIGCWKFVDREVKNKARDQINGRVKERVSSFCCIDTSAKPKVSGITAFGPMWSPRPPRGIAVTSNLPNLKATVPHFH